MSKRLLIVDDDNMLAKLYELELELTDHDVMVTMAGDGVKAMEMIDASQPDVLLMDLRLPKADGFVILKHLHDRQYHFPVIVVTNYDKDDYRDMCKQYDIVHEYLLKQSVAIHELAKKLEGYLSAA